MDYKNTGLIVPKGSVISEQMSGIDGRLKTIEEILASLESKLAPIVNPMSLDAVKAADDKMPSVSDLSQRLIVFNSVLSDDISRLQNLIDRIEL